MLLALLATLPVRAEPAPEEPLEVSGDAMPGDATGEVVQVVGNVRLRKGGFEVTADRLRYEKKAELAVATGEVNATEGEYRLACRRLRYHIGTQRAVAWESPLLTRRSPLRDEERAFEVVELSATQIVMDIARERAEALDRVVLTRWIERDGARELDVRVTADEVEIDQAGRSSLFQGGVEIESPTMAARAERAWLEEPLDRLTLVGRAQAWSVGPGGERTDRVSGNKILHFLKGRRSIVFGSVEGRIRIGEK